MIRRILLISAGALAGCTSTAPPAAASKPLVQSAPAHAAPTRVRPPRAGTRAATPLALPGLEAVIGTDATGLVRLFGPPRLEVVEGDARKLQWSGTACVLDAYL